MQGVYAIKNKITNQQYIGSAVSFKHRWDLHLLQLKKKTHHSRYLLRSWEKYGADSFEFIILEYVNDKNDLLIREQWWMDNVDSSFNMSPTASSTLGSKRSKESREKMRKAHLGKKLSPLQLANRIAAQSGDNHWTRKKKFSEEAKKRMSEAQKRLFKNGYIHPRNKAILQYDKQNNFIKEWVSVSEANRFYNNKNIINCLQGRSKTAVGYIWRYKT